MKLRFLTVLAIFVVTSGLLADRWDIAEGNMVEAASPTIFPADRMFGDPGTGTGELGSCIFSDRDPEGLLDFVEFRTTEEVPLIGYILQTGADTLVPLLRGVKSFALYADFNNDNNWTLIDSFDLIQPVDSYAVRDSRHFAMAVASHWRIEVIRFSFEANLDGILYRGPRVVELDAVAAENLDVPSVILTSPEDDSVFQEGENISFEVQASDASHAIKRVEIIDTENNTVLVSTKSPPYQMIWSNVPPKEYIVRAKAVDELGGAGYSAPIKIKVARNLPSISLSNVIFEEGVGLRFDIAGFDYGSALIIETSTDLVTWSELVEEYAYADPHTFLDQSLIPRFYRVKQWIY
jgi:hypothetical protein